jgi:hypothetical protein
MVDASIEFQAVLFLETSELTQHASRLEQAFEFARCLFPVKTDIAIPIIYERQRYTP